MKTWLVVVLASVVGVTSGVGLAVLRHRWAPWDGTAEGVRAAAPPVQGDAPELKDKPSKILVVEDTYDFGTMENIATERHDFVLKNVGQGVLTLASGETSCKCTLIALQEMRLAPGESTKVTLEWRAKGMKGLYRQHATVITNDPERNRVTLTITGRISPTLEALPNEVVFSKITADEPASQLVRLVNYKRDPFTLQGYTFSDPTVADRFEVRPEPLPAAELAKIPDAKNGYLLQLTVKPGLPLGAFQQTISMRTNIKGLPELNLPVKGTVVSEISVMGRGWSEDTGILTLGATTTQEELERTVMLIARGPQRNDVKFQMLKVEPDLLKVEIGPTTPMADGAATKTPLTIRIPRGSQPAEYLSMEAGRTGTIRLATHHPKAPELLMHVRFAVRN